MKKLTLIAALFGFASLTQAMDTYGFKAIGYDDNLKHITARRALGANDLDIGVGFNFDNSASGDAKFQAGASAFYLIKTNDWGPVDNYLSLGANVSKNATGDFGLGVFAGFQPEITLMDRFILSTRFGLNLDVAPDVKFYTAGQGISIVNGVNFKVLF